MAAVSDSCAFAANSVTICVYVRDNEHAASEGWLQGSLIVMHSSIIKWFSECCYT